MRCERPFPHAHTHLSLRSSRISPTFLTIPALRMLSRIGLADPGAEGGGKRHAVLGGGAPAGAQREGSGSGAGKTRGAHGRGPEGVEAAPERPLRLLLHLREGSGPVRARRVGQGASFGAAGTAPGKKNERARTVAMEVVDVSTGPRGPAAAARSSFRSAAASAGRSGRRRGAPDERAGGSCGWRNKATGKKEAEPCGRVRWERTGLVHHGQADLGLHGVRHRHGGLGEGGAGAPEEPRCVRALERGGEAAGGGGRGGLALRAQEAGRLVARVACQGRAGRSERCVVERDGELHNNSAQRRASAGFSPAGPPLLPSESGLGGCSAAAAKPRRGGASGEQIPPTLVAGARARAACKDSVWRGGVWRQQIAAI